MKTIETSVRRAVQYHALPFGPTREWAQQGLDGDMGATAAAVAANIAIDAAKRAYNFDAARERASRAWCAARAANALAAAIQCASSDPVDECQKVLAGRASDLYTAEARMYADRAVGGAR